MTQWIVRFVLGVPLAVSACGSEPLHPGALDDPFAAEVAGVRDAHMSGQVGPRVVDVDGERVGIYPSDTDLLIVSATQLETHAVMLQLTVTTEEALLVPGVAEHATLTEGIQRLRLLGCTGQSIGVYDEYESIADDLTLIVEDAQDGAAGDVRVTATALWTRPDADPPADPIVATLTFVLER